MKHVSFVQLSGFRLREEELRELGASLPGLRPRAEALAGMPGLSLLTLAALTPEEWSASYRDPAAVDDALVHDLVSESPALVAISALSASTPEAYALCDRLRAQGVRTVLGGLHASALPEEAGRHATAVVAGEGEPVWGDVLRDAQRGALRPVYRALRPFDLAAAPVPRWDLLGSGVRPRMLLQTERGCPFACEFCGASRLLGPHRTKPAERVRAELASIRALDPRPRVELADDNTFAAGLEEPGLLDALADSGALWFTETDWMVGERPMTVRRMAEAGCVQVLVGLESTAPEHRGMGSKAAPLERVLEAVERIQEEGIAVLGCFVVGGPGEDAGSLECLARLCGRAPFADVQLTLLTPFPGTALRRRLAARGRLLDVGWSSYTLFDVTFEPDRMSAAALRAGFRELLREVHGSAASARRAAIRRDVWRRHPRRFGGRDPVGCGGSTGASPAREVGRAGPSDLGRGGSSARPSAPRSSGGSGSGAVSASPSQREVSGA